MVNAAHVRYNYRTHIRCQRKSAVILPDDLSFLSGHSTGMNLREILSRIETRLVATNQSADGASRAANKPDAIRNLRRAVKNNQRSGISTDTLAALAPVLETTPAWLVSGVEDLRSEDVAASLDRPLGRTVKLKGYVGAGAEAHFYALADEDFEEVEAPLDATDQTIAVEIKGKSWGPQMDGWLVFYDDIRSPITEDMFGKTCVVGLADDRILLKTIKRERDGSFTLLSNSNEPPIKDAEIEWAAKVINMRPR